jgi:hypothetical protein
MKKILMVLGILGVGSLSIPLTGMAADEGPAEAKEGKDAVLTSDVKLTIGAGILSLDEVCDFSFSTTVRDISKGDANNLVNQTLTNNSVGVSDYRGKKDDSWQLTAQLTSVITDGATNLENAELMLNGTVNNVSEANTSVLKTALKAPTLKLSDSTPSLILGTNGGNGSGSTTINYSGATLKIPQAEVYASDKYTGKITWTLTNSYTAE